MTGQVVLGALDERRERREQKESVRADTICRCELCGLEAHRVPLEAVGRPRAHALEHRAERNEIHGGWLTGHELEDGVAKPFCT